MHHQLPESPPYYAGRFTNGPVWAEVLAQTYFGEDSPKHLLDYAFGGAGVVNETDDDDVLFTLNREIDAYLLAHHGKANPNSLFIVWIGGNNYLGLPDDLSGTVQEVITGTEKGINHLVHAGAKHILLINLPDIGATPWAVQNEIPEIADVPKALTAFSDLHNQQLIQTWQSLRDQHPEVQWLYFRSDQLFQEIQETPQKYGFNNITDSCYDVVSEQNGHQSVLKMVSKVHLQRKISPEACNQYFFFDIVHPTKHVHALMAQRIKALLDEQQIAFQASSDSEEES